MYYVRYSVNSGACPLSDFLRYAGRLKQTGVSRQHYTVLYVSQGSNIQLVRRRPGRRAPTCWLFEVQLKMNSRDQGEPGAALAGGAAMLGIVKDLFPPRHPTVTGHRPDATFSSLTVEKKPNGGSRSFRVLSRLTRGERSVML